VAVAHSAYVLTRATVCAFTPHKVWLGVPLLNALKKHDAPCIGITQFVPISGKTQAESRVLEKLKGRVVWPHVSWLLVRALDHLARSHNLSCARELADAQRAKLLAHTGCGEWYGYDAEMNQVVAGGDPGQAWSAAGIILDHALAPHA
jgi:hypothetical protein